MASGDESRFSQKLWSSAPRPALNIWLPHFDGSLNKMYKVRLSERSMHCHCLLLQKVTAQIQGTSHQLECWDAQFSFAGDCGPSKGQSRKRHQVPEKGLSTKVKKVRTTARDPTELIRKDLRVSSAEITPSLRRKFPSALLENFLRRHAISGDC